MSRLPRPLAPARRFQPSFRAVGLCLALMAAGCTRPTLAIPPDELHRIAHAPPDQRARLLERVRVLQDTTLSDDPQTGDPCAEHDHHPPPSGSHSGLVVELHGHGHHAGHHGRRHRRGRHRSADAAKPRPARGSGGSSSGGSVGSIGGGSGGGGGGGGGGGDVAVAAVVVVVAIVVAAGATIGLIATEGMRYDGWVALDPHHPVHLSTPGRAPRSMHLADLRPGDIAPGTRAVIRPSEGEGVDFLGRAPLDRQGVVWRMEFGGMQVLTPDRGDPGVFASTMQLGYFPSQTFGVLATTTLALGSHGADDLVAARYGVEAQLMPVALDPLHLGLYGMTGAAYNVRGNGRFEDGDSTRFMVAGGALAELELTTRLSMTARFGANWRIWDDGSASGLERPAFIGTLGFAIY